jgi:hypothetical protein
MKEKCLSGMSGKEVRMFELKCVDEGRKGWGQRDSLDGQLTILCQSLIHTCSPITMIEVLVVPSEPSCLFTGQLSDSCQ